jgi:hypothetical protein
MNVTEHQAAEAEAHQAVHSAIISDLRNASPLGRLALGEVRAVLHRMAEQGYTIAKAPSVAEAKAGLAALPKA